MTSTTLRLERSSQVHLLLLLCVTLSLSVLALSRRGTSPLDFGAAEAAPISADQIDAALQTTATAALGNAEGTIIVMDPQTGRVRALVNPELAFGHAFAPGSTIKPFTALAAMQAGLIDDHSRVLCRQHYAHEDFATVCSHPTDLPAFDPEQALAYSCNYYFGKLGERLSEDSFRRTLASFGFGRKVGPEIPGASSGKLAGSRWSSEAALGEGPYTQVTPAQLIEAYSAIANGGNLWKLQTERTENFKPQLAATVEIDPAQRAIILAGMRCAVRFGTAQKSGLDSLPMNVIGKTGTSTPLKGFRTQGWFVGFAGGTSEAFAADDVNLAVLVFMKRSHGADAAAVSRPLFEEFARLQGSKNAAANTAKPRRTAAANSTTTPTVRVHLVRENTTVEMPFENYVLGVVATEGSTEDEPEALKALAVAARTYALKNSGRHQREGFDFCTTTHCQRFQLTPENEPPDKRIVDAVRSTSGEIITDAQGQVAESFFGASCGGATANMSTLWGGAAPAYLRGVHDDYCTTMPHHTWTDVISRSQLLTAIKSDPRTDVGGRLDDVIVSRRDASDRAEQITLTGDKRKVVRGWDFKIIVGRALGWNKLKSSRFTVQRIGNDYLFRGSGFGHGLGLCQEGAHVMAQRGTNYRQILAKYFPGTSVRRGEANVKGAEDVADDRKGFPLRPLRDPLRPLLLNMPVPATTWHADLLPNRSVKPRQAHGSARLGLASEHFRVTYSAATNRKDVELALSILDSAHANISRRAGPLKGLPTLTVNINDTTGDFTGRTGQPWWAAAATRGGHIELQPLAVLKQRGVLATTLRHEIAHAFIDAASHNRAPRWLSEGFALHLAGEGKMISRFAGKEKLTIAELEDRLARTVSAEEMRALYAAAFRRVQAIIQAEGENKVWRQLASY